MFVLCAYALYDMFENPYAPRKGPSGLSQLDAAQNKEILNTLSSRRVTPSCTFFSEGKLLYPKVYFRIFPKNNSIFSTCVLRANRM